MFNKLHTGFYNFPTLGGSFSNGDLTFTYATAAEGIRAIFGKAIGRWYFEVNFSAYNLNNRVGLFNPETSAGFQPGSNTNKEDFGFSPFAGDKYTLGGSSAYGNAWSTETIGVYWDADAGKIFFAINGTVQNSGNPVTGTGAAFQGIAANTVLIPGVFVSGAGVSVTFNFGETSFSYDPLGNYAAWEDTGPSFAYAYKKNNANAVSGNAGCDAFDSSWDSSHSFGYPTGGANGPYDGYFQLDDLHLTGDDNLISASVGFEISASEATGGCKVTLSAFSEDKAGHGPTEPTNCATLTTELADQTDATVDWIITAWVAGSQAMGWSPDIVDIVNELINQSAWTSGDEILLFYEDNGSTATHNRSFIWNANDPHYFILEVKYMSGPYPEAEIDGWLPIPSGVLRGGNTISGGLPIPSGNMVGGFTMSGGLPVPSGEIRGTYGINARVDGGLPIPGGLMRSGSHIIGGLPIPYGDILGAHGIDADIVGRLPVPGGVIRGVIEVHGQINGGLPVPAGTIAGKITEIGTIDGGLPIPAGTIVGGTPPVGVINGGLPIPGGKITGRIIGRFATLKHSRC